MNVPQMTVGKNEEEKLREENMKLKQGYDEMKENLTKKLEVLQNELDTIRANGAHEEALSYMRGRIDGLEFSIRCNGVSGDDIK